MKPLLLAAILAFALAAPAVAAPKPPAHCTTIDGITTVVWAGHAVSMPANLVRYYGRSCIAEPSIPEFARQTETIRGSTFSPQQQFDENNREFQFVDHPGGLGSLRFDDTTGGLIVSGGTGGIALPVNATIISPLDGSGNVNVDVQTNNAPLATGTNSIGRLTVGGSCGANCTQDSGAALQAGCTGTPVCTWTTAAFPNSTLFYIENAGPAMSTGTITCYNNSAASGTTLIATAFMGNSQIVTFGPTGIRLGTGKITCVTATAVMAAGASIEAVGL